MNKKFSIGLFILIISIALFYHLFGIFHTKYFSYTIVERILSKYNASVIRNGSKPKYIFSDELWGSNFHGKISFKNTTMCDIPETVRSIADASCPPFLRRPCTKLPCAFIHRSSETDKHVKCQANGKLIKSENKSITTNSSKVQHIECIISPALDLFVNGPPYPSLKTHGRLHMTKELYNDILTRRYRSSESIWGLTFSGQSIAYHPSPGTQSTLSLFDITHGYDRHLYDMVTYGYLFRYVKFFLNDSRISFNSTLLSKNRASSFVTAPVLWINSNCGALSNRTRYMEEFMSYISVDSWGKCLRNKGPNLPPEISKIYNGDHSGGRLTGNWVDANKAMMKHYLFTIAFENSIAHDYITEKLWMPLAVGSVPIYYGAPNVEEWLPCNDCIIDLRKFPNPHAAAQFIMTVSKNETQYAEFHKWRYNPLPSKFQKIIDYFKRASNYSLDCIMCAMAHSKSPKATRYEILHDIGPKF